MNATFLLSLFTLKLISLPALAAPPTSVGIKVEAEGKADYGDGKKSETKTQTRTLRIALTNTGKTAVPQMSVKWTIYGHTMDGHKLVEIKSGTENAALAAGSGIEISTAQVSISGAREHAVSSGGGRRMKFKNVPASGHQYYGYSVEVYDGGVLIASEYSQPSLEKAAAKAP